MTVAVYILLFPDRSRYIGGSKHVEARYSQHLYAFSKGRHTAALQRVYDRLGPPTLIVMPECTPEELPAQEAAAIRQFRPELNYDGGGRSKRRRRAGRKLSF